MGAHTLNNLELMQALFNLASSCYAEEGQQCHSFSETQVSAFFFYYGKVIIIGIVSNFGDEQKLYVLETSTFEDLCANLTRPCPSCSGYWTLYATKQVIGYLSR